MKVVLILLILFSTSFAFAEGKNEKKIVQVDKFGNVLHHKGSVVVQEDGKMVSVDKFGNRMPHRPVTICNEEACLKDKTRKK